MPNVLADASEWLSKMRRTHLATLVTYRHDGDAIQVSAQKTSVNTEVDRGDGVVLEAQRMDWIVAADDLVFDGVKIRPAEGDQIEHYIGTTLYTYEVIPLGTESHCRPVGPYGNAWRIHSKLIESE